MEGPDADSALRLWRALCRRCVAPYAEHATAPLTLAGWVAWSTGDEPSARVALGLALRLDDQYVFARLLHQACNEGLDPETLRNCLRRESTSREELQSAADGDSRRIHQTPDQPQTPDAAGRRGRPRTRQARAPIGTRPRRPAKTASASAHPRKAAGQRSPDSRRDGRQDSRSEP